MALLDGSRLPSSEVMEHIADRRDPYRKGWVWPGHLMDRTNYANSLKDSNRSMDGRDYNLFKTKDWIDAKMLGDARLQAHTFAPLHRSATFASSLQDTFEATLPAATSQPGP